MIKAKLLAEKSGYIIIDRKYKPVEVVGKYYELESKTLRGIKSKASRIVNNYWRTVNEMLVYLPAEHTIDGKPATITLTRIDKIYPNNTREIGTWK